jgi:hypothetical protein
MIKKQMSDEEMQQGWDIGLWLCSSIASIAHSSEEKKTNKHFNGRNAIPCAYLNYLL